MKGFTYKFALMSVLIFLAIIAPSVSYAARKKEKRPLLTSICLVDRNGFSETISAPDRLRQYENVDFFSPQPYQKAVRVYGRDRFGNMRSFLTSYHPNSQIKQYLEAINNRACGIYREWYANGVLKIEAFTLEGLADIGPSAENTWAFDGCCRAWNEEGVLIAEIFYEKGSLEGTSLYYHPNGKIWKKIPYLKNQIEGDYEIYLDSGCLLQKTRYVKGIKDGEAIRYWEEGKIAAEEKYVQGLLLQGKYYNQAGESIAQIEEGNGFKATFGKEGPHEIQEYRQGALEGETRVYEQDRLVKIYHMKNELKQGEEIEFWPKKNALGEYVPQLSISWIEGTIQGVTKTWYENGSLESQREMSRNSKNGAAIAWYRDGSLMLMEEYVKDKLIKGEYFKKGSSFPISYVREGEGVATLFDAEGNFLRKILYSQGRPQE